MIEDANKQTEALGIGRMYHMLPCSRVSLVDYGAEF